MKEIPLKNSTKVALVSDEDYPYLSKYVWGLSSHGYVRFCGSNSRYMHRFILPKSKIVDHIDGNGLNNQRTNLRDSDESFNAVNTLKKRSTDSKYKGVSWMTQRGKWRVRIKYNYESIHIGMFTDEIEAAKAYDLKAFELFGKHARLNFPTI